MDKLDMTKEYIELSRRYNELFTACKALLEAEHYDHFEARMSDGEMDAINLIKEHIYNVC